MSKPIKIVLSVIALAILLPIIAAIIASQVIDTDDIKQLAAEQVSKHTGRELTIDGEIDLSVFPWISLDMGHTRLSNAHGFGPEPMVEIDKISVSLKLLPLFSGTIELDTITLAGLTADLQINAEGRSNFEDLAGSAAPAEGGGKAPATAAETLSGGALAAFTLGGIEITDARIHWRDQTSQIDLEVTDFNLHSGAILPGKPVDLRMGALITLQEPGLESRIDTRMTLQIDDKFEKIALNDLVLEISASGDSLPGGKLESRLSAAIAVDLATDTLTMKQLVLTAMGLELTGDLPVEQLSQTPQSTITLKIAPFNAQKLLATLALPAAETADSEALKSVSADLQISANDNQLILQTLAIQLDQTQITGEAKIVDFDSPAITFKLAIDDIDLDRYLPPTSSATASAEPAKNGTSEEPLNLGESLAGLAALNLEGSLTIGKLKVSNLKSSDISLVVKAKKGHLIIDPMSANLYDGSFSGSVDLNGALQPPTVSLTQALSGVNLGPLIKDLAGMDQFSGTADIQAKLSTRGNQADELTRSLNGNLGFNITGGTINGINIDRSACLARQGIKSLSNKQSDEPCPPDEPTRFSVFLATAKITNGVLKNGDLFIEQQRTDPTKFLHIKGAGTVDLNQQTIDYRVTAGGVKKLADNSYKARGTAIPVRISGSLSEPSVLPDISGLIKAEAKSKLREKLAPKLAPSDDDSPADQLKKQLLRGLFN